MNSQSYNRYSYCWNNPLKYTDPSGDLVFVPILVGMAVGALMHTSMHLLNNQGSFNNWNWGGFIGSVVAGGVGGGVSSALTSAGIGGFVGGAITGAASGFTQTLTSGLINNNLSAETMMKSVLMGALVGGTIQGLGATIKGRRFWDGADVKYTLIAQDKGLNHVMQNGKENCAGATGEMAIKAQGGNFDQNDIRSWNGGDPNLDPMKDGPVIESIRDNANLKVEGVQYGDMKGYATKSDYAVNSLKNGRSVIMSTQNHSIAVKSSHLKTVVKINGSIKTSVVHSIYDPAQAAPYPMSAKELNSFIRTVFSIYR